MLELLHGEQTKKKDRSIVRYRFNTGTMADVEFSGDMLVCGGLTCCCNVVHLELKSSETPESFSVPLDVEKRAVAKDAIKGAANLLFAERIVSELSQDEWNKLKAAYIFSKEETTENSDLSDVIPNFPERSEGGTVYDMREVLPYAAPFRLRDDDGEIQAIDGYCCIPNCSCKNSFIGFVRPSSQEITENSFTNIRLSYFSEKIDEIVNIAVDNSLPPPDQLVSMLVKEYPDIWSRLRKRHERMKKLYQRFLQNTSDTVERSSPKVGRNDLCPCGSGKKYKKCCIAR